MEFLLRFAPSRSPQPPKFYVPHSIGIVDKPISHLLKVLFSDKCKNI